MLYFEKTPIPQILMKISECSILDNIYIEKYARSTKISTKQAQLRLCKLGPGTVFLIKFFSEIKNLSVALLLWWLDVC